MVSIIGWLIGKKIFGAVIGEKGARVIATLGLFLLVLGILGTVVAMIRRDAVDDHQAKVERRAAPATDQAAAERARDTIKQAKNEQEAHDAVHSVPDAAPAGPSHALACQRLRKLGRNPPSCR
jgi:type VI protein secretion system component VasK